MNKYLLGAIAFFVLLLYLQIGENNRLIDEIKAIKKERKEETPIYINVDSTYNEKLVAENKKYKIVEKEVIVRDTFIDRDTTIIRDTITQQLVVKPDTVKIYEIVKTIVEIVRTDTVILNAISKHGDLRVVSTISNNKNFGAGLMFEKKRLGLIFQANTNNEYSIGATYKLTN